MRTAGRVLLLVAVWMLFECGVSWLATCDPGEYATNYGGEKNHCTAFNGPVASLAHFVGISLFRFLHAYEKELIAGFTVVLAFSTIGLWWSTRQLWTVTQIAAQHIPIVERAFIHGGVHPDGRSAIRNGETITAIRVRFSMANYGKTPGFIKSVKVGSGKLSELSDEPIYSNDIPVSDLYFPMMTIKDLRYPDDVEVTVPADGKHVVFQRVFYNDIFDEPHYSGSIHLMYIESGTVRDRIVTSKPKYWERN